MKNSKKLVSKNQKRKRNLWGKRGWGRGREEECRKAWVEMEKINKSYGRAGRIGWKEEKKGKEERKRKEKRKRNVKEHPQRINEFINIGQDVMKR